MDKKELLLEGKYIINEDRQYRAPNQGVKKYVQEDATMHHIFKTFIFSL